jgi:DNA-directed RNA polymerase specialized sigma24 family protein
VSKLRRSGVQKPNFEWIRNWFQEISTAIPKAVWILRGHAKMDMDAAYTSLSILILELIDRWEESGPPKKVKDWAPYLATSAFHVYIREPRKDSRLLEFRAPVGTENSPPLDTPDGKASPEEPAILRELIIMVALRILELPKSQMKVIMLWALDYSDSDVSFALGVSQSRVRSLRSNALRTLRSKMSPGSDDSGGQEASEIA